MKLFSYILFFSLVLTMLSPALGMAIDNADEEYDCCAMVHSDDTDTHQESKNSTEKDCCSSEESCNIFECCCLASLSIVPETIKINPPRFEIPQNFNLPYSYNFDYINIIWQPPKFS